MTCFPYLTTTRRRPVGRVGQGQAEQRVGGKIGVPASYFSSAMSAATHTSDVNLGKLP